jgi:hypothetical protein
MAAFSMAALGACGGDDDGGSDPPDAAATESTADAAPGEPTGVGSEDEGEAGAADAAADDVDFPIPAPDGLVLDVLASTGADFSSGQRQLYYASDDFDRVVAFYDDWTGGAGDWSRSETDGTVLFQDIGGEFIRMITISPEEDPGALADGPVTSVILVTNE